MDSQLPSRASGTRMRCIGAPHSLPAITLPRCDEKPAITTSPPHRSRASEPTFTIPTRAMSVARAPATRALRPHRAAPAPPHAPPPRARSVGGPPIAHVGVVRPDDRLRFRAVVLEEALQRLD